MGFAIRFSHWGYYGFCHVYPYGFSHSMSFAITSKQLWYHVFSHATLQYFAQHRLPLLLIMMEIIIMTMTMTITMTVTVTCIQKIIVEDRDAHCKVHNMISLKSFKTSFHIPQTNCLTWHKTTISPGLSEKVKGVSFKRGRYVTSNRTGWVLMPSN